jgi:hypothetical protein
LNRISLLDAQSKERQTSPLTRLYLRYEFNGSFDARSRRIGLAKTWYVRGFCQFCWVYSDNVCVDGCIFAKETQRNVEAYKQPDIDSRCLSLSTMLSEAEEKTSNPPTIRCKAYLGLPEGPSEMWDCVSQ